jgi:diketogulonate reductase-like aldo/keto reductase
MKRITLPGGDTVPALGQGTWNIGDDPARRAAEIDALQHGIDLGMTLVDTAEMYGEGNSEQLVGEAIAGRRDEVFLVTKVYPHNASRRAMRSACEASLRRLGIATIDMYLLHWPGPVPLDETVASFETLRKDGKIRHWGVSNFDTDAMRELMDVPGGAGVQTDQVLYNLSRRGPEWDLLPWLRRHGMPAMAYSPLEQGRLLKTRAMTAFAKKHGMTPAQVAIAWLLAQDEVIVIPKAGSRERVEENAGALELPLTPEQLRELDELFAPPTGPTPLAML